MDPKQQLDAEDTADVEVAEKRLEDVREGRSRTYSLDEVKESFTQSFWEEQLGEWSKEDVERPPKRRKVNRGKKVRKLRRGLGE